MSEDLIIKLNELLKTLTSEVPGTKGSLLINSDGFIIASDMREEPDHYETGQLLVSFSLIGKKFTSKVFSGEGIRYSIWNEKGDIQFFPVNEDLLLVIFSDSDSRPGLLLLRITKMIEILRNILEDENG